MAVCGKRLKSLLREIVLAVALANSARLKVTRARGSFPNEHGQVRLLSQNERQSERNHSTPNALVDGVFSSTVSTVSLASAAASRVSRVAWAR